MPGSEANDQLVQAAAQMISREQFKKDLASLFTTYSYHPCFSDPAIIRDVATRVLMSMFGKGSASLADGEYPEGMPEETKVAVARIRRIITLADPETKEALRFHAHYRELNTKSAEIIRELEGKTQRPAELSLLDAVDSLLWFTTTYILPLSRTRLGRWILDLVRHGALGQRTTG